jgi:hypothetical protein
VGDPLEKLKVALISSQRKTVFTGSLLAEERSPATRDNVSPKGPAMLSRTPDNALRSEGFSSALRCLLAVLLTLSATLLRAAPMDLRRAEPAPEEVPRIDDASADGWVSESLSSAAGSRLGEIAHILEHPEKISGDALSGLIDPGFASSA